MIKFSIDVSRNPVRRGQLMCFFSSELHSARPVVDFSLASSSIKPLDRKTIYQKIGSFICQVISKPIGSGTGFILNDNLIVIPGHLVQCKGETYGDVEPVTVIYKNHSYTAFYHEPYNLEYAKFYGCCIFKIDDPSFKPDLSDPLQIFEKDLEVGEKVYFAGFPLTQDNPTFHCGTVSCTPKQEDGRPHFFTIDATVVPGNSGGPVFVVVDNTHLQLVGVIASQIADLDPTIAKKRRLLRRLQEPEIAAKIKDYFPTQIIELTISTCGAKCDLNCDCDCHKPASALEPPKKAMTENSDKDHKVHLDFTPQSIYQELLELCLNNLSTGIGKAIYIKDFLDNMKSRDIFLSKNPLNELSVHRPQLNPNAYIWDFILTDASFGEVYHVVAAILINKKVRVCLNDANEIQKQFVDSVLNKDEKALGCRLNNKPKNCYSLRETTRIIQAELNNQQMANQIYQYFISPLSDLPLLETKSKEYLASLNLKQEGTKVAIFVRRATDKKTEDRNLEPSCLMNLVHKMAQLPIDTLILFGDAIEKAEKKDIQEKFSGETRSVVFMTGFPKAQKFQDIFKETIVSGQIFIFKLLQEKYQLKLIIGMKSGAMDGPAFTGIPMVFLEAYDKKKKKTDERMREASQSIPFLNSMPVECLELKQDEKCVCVKKNSNKCLLDLFMSKLMNLSFGQNNFVTQLVDIRNEINIGKQILEF